MSPATFGRNSEEIWARLSDKNWIKTLDRQEMGRASWSDERAPALVASLTQQRLKLDAIQREKEAAAAKQQQDRGRRSQRALIYCAIAAALAVAGVSGSAAVFGQNGWVAVNALCFAAIPICAGMAGAM